MTGGWQIDTTGVLASCPSCGKRNRLAYPHVDRQVRCGACRATLPAPSEPIEVPSSEVFDVLLKESVLPVVIDFWAPWCGPCRMVAPELAQVAQRAAGTWLVVKVNTEALPEVGERHRIRSIPTMALFHAGKELARVSGARPAADIEAFVSRALKASP